MPKAPAAAKPRASRAKTTKVSTQRKGASKSAREVVYDKAKVRLCVGDSALDDETARKLLGWKEEADKEQFGIDFQFRDEMGRKVRCLNNDINRPITWTNVLVCKQEILNGKWKFNFEPIIIGVTGRVVDGQHRLVALVLAVQEWQANPDRYQDHWPNQPTIETLVCFGCSEDDETVNTINTGRPRTLSDVIYRSSYFCDMNSQERKTIARIMDVAIKLVWKRTHASQGVNLNYLTHSEALSFIGRHERLLEAVRHIYEEDNDKSLSRYCSLGTAAGLLYLMGTCQSETDNEDHTGYFQVMEPHENQLDFSMWDKACEFFVLLASGHEHLSAVRLAIGRVQEDELADIKARIGTIVKAWNLYSLGDVPEVDDLSLEFVARDEVYVLTEFPTVGGIDLGEPTI